MENDVLDVAVVGAGVGGCYSAYRLLEDAAVRARSGGVRVALFEQTHRIGGRLLSARVHHEPSLVADLGAMRLHRGLHTILALVRHLGLEAELVPFEFGRPENLVHLRGVCLRQSDLERRSTALYRLRAEETGRVPGDLVLDVAERLLPGFAELRRLHHEAWRRRDRRRAAAILTDFRARRDRLRVGTRSLCHLAWSEVLHHVLSRPAVDFLHDAGGYDVTSIQENAAEQLDLLFRTPPDAEYVCLCQGMESLARVLHSRFTAAGGDTHTGHRLLRIDKALTTDGRETSYWLTLAVQDQHGHPTGEHFRVQTRSVVIAMPQEALRRLDEAGLPFTPQLRHDLDTVEPVPAFKLFLLYPQAWWRNLGITRGRSTSDTPLRQLWYGGSCQPPGAASELGPGLLLATYPSGPSTEAWDRLRDGPSYPPAGPAPRASAAMVEYAHELVAHMHNLPDLNRPLAACWQDWSQDPHDGAWHIWRPGRDARDVGPRMRQPIPGERVHVVSDCWTVDPGSIEGTIECAETVLCDFFGLSTPPWLGTAGNSAC